MKKMPVANDSKQIRIEKDIPIPKSSNHAMYPWAAMEVGDSIIIRHSGLLSYVRRVYAPRKFISRKTPEGVRAWRIE